jgi:hypothetical protein
MTDDPGNNEPDDDVLAAFEDDERAQAWLDWADKHGIDVLGEEG